MGKSINNQDGFNYPPENPIFSELPALSGIEQTSSMRSENLSAAQKILECENKFKGEYEQVALVSRNILGVPKGLHSMHHSFLPLPSHYQKDQLVGDQYIYERDKRFGVEPGFEAYKSWKFSDDHKLNDPSHHFYEQANQYLKNRLTFDVKFQKIEEEIRLNDSELNEIEMLSVLRNHPSLKPLIQRHLMLTNRKFHKRHYVKLDYSQPGPDGKVKIPFYRAKAPKIFGSLGKLLHQHSTEATPREKNLGAVTEALANDIFTALEFGGQTLKLIKATYEDGSIKLLLDGTEVAGPHGEKFSTFEGQIKRGYLEGNEVRTADGKRYPFDHRAWGQNKIKALLLGDRDKVGDQGGNIGFIIVNGQARVMNIDPGKSLDIPQNLTQDDHPKPENSPSFVHYLLKKILFEVMFFLTGSTNLMTQENLRTDLSFEQPNTTLLDKFRKGYKNYSIFDDTKLSEKMEGMRTILKNWKQVENILDCYIEEFSQPGELDFLKELSVMKQQLMDRKNYFEKVLAERLALSNEQLDFLDHVEKLTSPTQNQVKTPTGLLQFQHLQMASETRKEWHMQKIQAEKEIDQVKAHEYELYYQASSAKDAHRTYKKLKDYQENYHTSTGEVLPLHFKIKGQRVVIEIQDEQQLQKLMEGLSETQIAKYKHQPLRISS